MAKKEGVINCRNFRQKNAKNDAFMTRLFSRGRFLVQSGKKIVNFGSSAFSKSKILIFPKS
jgi:hypothetical protein